MEVVTVLHCGRYSFILKKTNKQNGVLWWKLLCDHHHDCKGADEGLCICIQILVTRTHHLWMQDPRTGEGSLA